MDPSGRVDPTYAPAALSVQERRAQVAEMWRAYYGSNRSHSAADAALRRALQTDAGMVAVRRKVLRQKVSEASLLLWFAQQSRVEPHLRISSSGGAGNPSPKLTQKYRCGKCDECLVGDCGCCASCLDKPKFGGRGFRKQACLMRRCAFVQKCAQFRRLGVTKS